MAELLKQLTEIGGVSGDEGRVRKLISDNISPLLMMFIPTE